jgi:hypothetical protein
MSPRGVHLSGAPQTDIDHTRSDSPYVLVVEDDDDVRDVVEELLTDGGYAAGMPQNLLNFG